MFIRKSARQAAPCVKGRKTMCGDQIGQKCPIRVRVFANEHSWAKGLDIPCACSVKITAHEEHVTDGQGGKSFF